MNKIIIQKNHTASVARSSIVTSVSVSASLLAIACIVFATSASAYIGPNITVSRDMTIGSTGEEVVMLQGLMSEMGYLNVPTGIPFGYYGQLTQNAVAKYQANMSVAPAVGYYGNLTKIALRTDFASRNWLNLLSWN